MISYYSADEDGNSSGEEGGAVASAWGQAASEGEVAMSGVDDAWGSAWPTDRVAFPQQIQHHDQQAFDMTTLYSEALAPSPDPAQFLPSSPSLASAPYPSFAYHPQPHSIYSFAPTEHDIFSPHGIDQAFGAPAPAHLQWLDLGLDNVMGPDSWGSILSAAELDGGVLEMA